MRRGAACSRETIQTVTTAAERPPGAPTINSLGWLLPIPWSLCAVGRRAPVTERSAACRRRRPPHAAESDRPDPWRARRPTCCGPDGATRSRARRGDRHHVDAERRKPHLVDRAATREVIGLHRVWRRRRGTLRWRRGSPPADRRNRRGAAPLRAHRSGAHGRASSPSCTTGGAVLRTPRPPATARPPPRIGPPPFRSSAASAAAPPPTSLTSPHGAPRRGTQAY